MKHFKLGKLSPKNSPKTLKLRSYLSTLPPIPGAVDWTGKVSAWLMLGNDTIGDCTAAACQHLAMLWTSQTGTLFTPTDAETLAAYSAITGYNPADPSTDQGANEEDVLDWWKKNSFAPGRPPITGYASIDVKNINDIKAAIYIFGGAYIGVQVPDNAEDQFNNGQPWSGTDSNYEGGHCLSGDTKISLLNGTETKISELPLGSDFWVYSCNGYGKIVPGKARSIGKTGTKNVLKITLDNGESLKCTNNHLFMLRNGEYIMASELKIGQSLMPLYRRKSSLKTMQGYEQILHPCNNNWNYTHRVVAANIYGNIVKKVVHHCDFNKINNSPENLKIMTWDDHTILHTRQNGLNAYSKSNEGRNKSRQLMRRLWSDSDWRAKMLEVQKANGKKVMDDFASKGIKLIDFANPETLRLNGIKHAKNLKPLTAEEASKRISAWNKKVSSDPILKEKRIHQSVLNLSKTWSMPVTDKQREARRKNAIMNNAKRCGEKCLNHKVLSIENAGCEDVYDITVEQYHNFATTAGVFVHNSVPLVAFDQNYFTCITWGAKQLIAYDWLQQNMEEAYAVISTDWLNSTGNCPPGFNMQQLLSDLNQV